MVQKLQNSFNNFKQKKGGVCIQVLCGEFLHSSVDTILFRQLSSKEVQSSLFCYWPWQEEPYTEKKNPLAEELTHQHPHFWFPARHSGASASLLCDWAICQEEDTGQNWTISTLVKLAKLSKSRNLLFFLISGRVTRVFPKLISPLLFLQLISQLIFPEKRKKHRKTTWN